MPSCPRCGRAAGEDASFCSACGARLTSRGSSAPQARKTVTVLFADVSGFTALGERLDPESLQQVMNRYFAEMRQIIARHGGIVEKLIGDAIMAVFGVPVLHEDDALRAARAALEMRTELQALNDELAERWDVRLQTHTGINTGEVVVGESVDGEPITYGDTVNVAQRLESSAAPSEILVGGVTARLLRGVGGLSPVRPLRVKGKAAPVEAWRLEAVGTDARRSARPGSEIVGRRAELAQLCDTFDRVVGGRRPEMVIVTGAAGIGKSRLAQALIDAVSDRAAVATGRCLPYGEGITYWPVADVVRGLAGRHEERAIATAAGDSAEGRTIARRIARVVGLAPGGMAVEEAHWAVRRLLEIRAEQRPLVVVIDDVHWAEPTLLDLLEHVATFAADVPLLVVCLARPELAERHSSWTNFSARSTLLPLGPLADEDAAALLAQLAAATGIEPRDAGRLLATAEGNPFFLEQLVAMRAEPGDLQDGTPASIQALLAARIDMLPPVERAVIDRAAVEGRAFHRSAVAELLAPDDRLALDQTLAALDRRQLIRSGPGDIPGESGYRFVHILVRDVAYELLPKAKRVELHERYAACLDRRAGGEYGEIVGYHLEQAHRWHAELRPSAGDERRALATSAGGRLGAAGRAALDRGDLPAGVNLLERTAALLPDDDPGRAPVLPELGLALVQLGRLPEAETILLEAARAAARRGDDVAEAHARTAEFFALLQLDPEAAAEELSTHFDELRRTFTTASDDLGLERLWRARALLHWLNGRAAQADAAWMRGVRHARRAGDEQGRADALTWLGSAAFAGPTSVPIGIKRCEAIIDQLGFDRRCQALTMRSLAGLHAMAGRFEVARELFARSRATLHELGVSMHSEIAQEEALVAFLAGDAVAAEAVLRPSYEHLQAIGERALMASTVGMLARALLEQGNNEEAWAFTEIAEETTVPDDLMALILYRSVRAQLLARAGSHEEADRLSENAVALAACTDFLSDHGDALIAHAEVLGAAGRTDEAAAAIQRALELHTRKGNVVSAGRAREMGDELVARRTVRS